MSFVSEILAQLPPELVEIVTSPIVLVAIGVWLVTCVVRRAIKLAVFAGVLVACWFVLQHFAIQIPFYN